MSVKTLNRIDPVGDDHEELIVESANKLGYRALLSRAVRPNVAESLKAAGVRPFDPRQVERYVNRAWWRGNALAIVLLGGGFTTFMVTSIVLSFIFWAPLAIVGLAVSFVYGVITIPLLMYNDKLLSWYCVPLSRYTGEVPEYVLRTALDVKKQLDLHKVMGYELKIMHLSVDEKAGRGDPFLVLETGERQEYLEAWDEPGFFKERTV